MYRNHRSVKEITKGKRQGNSRQQSPEPEKDDLASLLKEMRAGFKDIRGDLAKTNTKMDTVHNKIDTMEKHQKESEKKIYKEMGKIKDDICANNEGIDSKIKDSIVENIGPKYEELKVFVSKDIQRIVNKELELRDYAKEAMNEEEVEE